MPIRPMVQLGNPRLREAAGPGEGSKVARGEPAGERSGRYPCPLADWDWLRPRNRRTPAGCESPGDLRAIAWWRSLATHESGNCRAQFGEDRRLGCLPEFSFLCMQVERHRAITVRYQDPCAEWHEVPASHDQNLSELLPHEIDHLDGIVAVDRITDLKALCTREEFEKRYRASSPYALIPAK